MGILKVEQLILFEGQERVYWRVDIKFGFGRMSYNVLRKKGVKGCIKLKLIVCIKRCRQKQFGIERIMQQKENGDGLRRL